VFCSESGKKNYTPGVWGKREAQKWKTFSYWRRFTAFNLILYLTADGRGQKGILPGDIARPKSSIALR